MMKDAWERGSTPDEVYFETFVEAKPMRRSTTISGGLADLTFGSYKDLSGSWVEHQGVVWLGMITSDIPGAGSELLSALSKSCARLNLVMVGEPIALKPRDWDNARKFSYDSQRLIHWYMKHGFKVVQDPRSTRVVYSPFSSGFAAHFAVA
jgi:hypothetical protein